MDYEEFLRHVESTLNKIDARLDEQNLDIDLEIGDGKLVIEFDDGKQYILSSQSATQQLWLAEPLGGWHYDFQDGQFICDKRGQNLIETLEKLLSEKLDQEISLS